MMTLATGSSDGSMPHRCTCRQSKIGDTRAASTGMSSGFAPSRIRRVTSPTRVAILISLRIMPPTTPVPM